MAIVRAAPPRIPIQAGRVQTTKRTDPFYQSKEWRTLLDEIIAERGRRCEEMQCARTHHGGKPIRIFGDHIIELRDGGAPLDKTNIMLRCGSCHTRKTNRERALRMGLRATRAP